MRDTKTIDRLDAFLTDYADYHQSRGNIRCHFIGIPMILYSVIGQLLIFRIFQLGDYTITVAEVFIVLMFTFYVLLDFKLAVAMLILSIACDSLARGMAATPYVALVFFISGWIFQWFGHSRYEKKSPRLLQSLVHFFLSPLFLLNDLLQIRQKRRNTVKEVY